MVLRLIIQTLFAVAGMAALLFVLAGTLHWRGAQIFLAAMAGGGLLMGLWLARRDPALLKERIGSSRQKNTLADRILMPLLGLAFCAWLVFMALDARRHGFSQMPEWLNFAAGAAIVVGFIGVVRVFRENSFASREVKVQKDRGQRVIAKGPYVIVRHPLYSAAIFTYFAIPLALGSWAGFLAVPLLILGLVIRTLVEERVLKEQLEGYGDYMAKVRYRFVPYVW